MTSKPLDILCVSPIPPSPPRFGAQARLHGLMTELARRHNVTAVTLVDQEFDLDETRRAMQAYCRKVVLIPNPHGNGLAKRLLQMRSIASARSFERLRMTVPELQSAIDELLQGQRFDLVNLEFPFLGHLSLRQAPLGEPKPALVVDSHNIEFDLAHQLARMDASPERRAYYAVNWRKLQREELEAYRNADGICLCSEQDERRLLAHIPQARTTVIPNAADVEFYQPRPTDPSPDGRTVVFFGLMSYVPNTDGVGHFLRSTWPRIADRMPDARFKVIGGQPPPWLRAMAGPRIEVAGFVPDLRPHLAEAALVVVPLRLGGGTRLKIVEAMAMGKAIVSTSLGAEGIEGTPGQDFLIENDPDAFADAVLSVLADPKLAARIGHSARELAASRYAWSVAARKLEDFHADILARRVTSGPRT